MLDQKRLQEVLDYCPTKGEFTWKVRISGRRTVGQKAGGCHRTGYWRIQVDGKIYGRGRLVWLYVHGVWPREQIDHINLNKADDRISNLREATPAENTYNRSKNKNNTTGYTGVQLKRKKYVALIKGRYLGRFNTPEEAAFAYQTAARQLYGEYAYKGG